MDFVRYLTCDELEQKISDTEDNDRSLAKYSRITQEYTFPVCLKCRAPKIIHRYNDFSSCEGQPSGDFIEIMVEMLKQTKGIEKFALLEADEDIGRKKRLRSNEQLDSDHLPRGKKVDTKVTPSKTVGNITNDGCNIEHCDVIEVFTVNVSDHLEKVNKTAYEKIKSLQAIIDSLDPKENANKLTIGTLTAQLAQIEMNRETSLCSMTSIQSNKTGDIKIEKQRFCPSWTENLKYESFKKQLLNWNQKNKNDEAAKYYEVLESLKKNDKIFGLGDYVSGTVCDHFKDEVDPTVEKLITFLDNKYLKTAFERVTDLLQDLYSIRDTDERDPAKFFDRIEILCKKTLQDLSHLYL